MNLDVLLAMQNEDFRKAFGACLKKLRKQKRWSQKELAAKVDIRFQQLNKYESGLNLPPAEMLHQAGRCSDHDRGLPAYRQPR